MMSEEQVVIHGGLILVKDGEHRCAACRAELGGLKQMIELADNCTPDQCFEDIGRLCRAVGLHDGAQSKSPHAVFDGCIEKVASLTAEVARLREGIVGGDMEWHPADEQPSDSRAVYCIVEREGSAWIRLGTFQHGRWKDTNTFENIGCDWWHELPKSPKQRELLKEPTND